MPQRPRAGVAALTTVLSLLASLAAALVVGASPAAAATLEVSGIDVSRWQHPDGAPISWTKVRSAGHQFAIIKATEATTYTNPYFASDRSAARAAGLVVGAYHFARPALPLKTAGKQARHFVRVAGTQRADMTLPPVLDIENDGGLTKAQLARWTRRWLAKVQELTGRTPMIYSYDGFLRAEMGDLDSLAGYPLWYARYTKAVPTSLPGAWSRWTIWQHSSTGKVPGITGNVDLNWFHGTRAELLRLADGSGSGAVAPDAPTALTAELDGQDARLTWAPPLSDGGAPVTNHVVEVDGVVDGWTPTGSYVVMNVRRGEEHTFRVRAVNDVGTGPEATTTLTVPEDAGMGVVAGAAATTVTVETPTSVTGGTSSTLVATLRRADTQQTLRDRKVVLSVAPRKGTAPKPARLVTDVAGRVALPLRLRAHTTLTATFGGTARLEPASATASVRVRPTIKVRPSRTKVRRGTTITVRATVDALHAGDRVVRQVRRGGRWVTAGKGRVGSAGTVAMKARVTGKARKRSTYRTRVVLRATDAHLAATSRVLKIKVRPRR